MNKFYSKILNKHRGNQGILNSQFNQSTLLAKYPSVVFDRKRYKSMFQQNGGVLRIFNLQSK